MFDGRCGGLSQDSPSGPCRIRTYDQGIMRQTDAPCNDLQDSMLQPSSTIPEAPATAHTCEDLSSPVIDDAQRIDEVGIIISVWPNLPEAMRAGIVAMVKAAGKRGG